MLKPTVRLAVQVDVCPRCRGVWFDAGEIEQLIARASANATTRRTPNQRPILQRADDSAEVVELVTEVLFNFGPSAAELGVHAVKAVAEIIVEIISSSS